jgi:hypothetical protein
MAQVVISISRAAFNQILELLEVILVDGLPQGVSCLLGTKGAVQTI